MTATPWRGLPAAGLLIGFAGCAALLAVPAPSGLSQAAWSTLAVAFLMVAWWVGEAIPVATTALVPLILFPILGILPIEAAAAPYGDPVIFLFLAGLTLGVAVQRSGLHRRIALATIAAAGARPARLVLGFMLAAAMTSMWVSNTATAAMMLPVALSSVALVTGPPDRIGEAAAGTRPFALALLIGVAFAASVGGMATPIGTPPNALFIAFMRQTHGIEIGFAEWMILGMPTAAVFLLTIWAILTRLVFRLPAAPLPGMEERIAVARAALGPMSAAEARVAIVFSATAIGWATRPLLTAVIPGLSDPAIGLIGALVLFVVGDGRGGRLVDWAAMRDLPWSVLILFGGGLSLAEAIATSGLAATFGTALAGLGALDVTLLVGAAILLTIALSEVASNTATAAMLFPIAAALGGAMGLAPHTIAVPIALAASCGLMLPIATPPNAIFYAGGYFSTGELARAGALCDLAGALIVLAASRLLAPLIWGG